TRRGVVAVHDGGTHLRFEQTVDGDSEGVQYLVLLHSRDRRDPGCPAQDRRDHEGADRQHQRGELAEYFDALRGDPRLLLRLAYCGGLWARVTGFQAAAGQGNLPGVVAQQWRT